MTSTPFSSRGNGNLIIQDGDTVAGDSATGGAGGDLIAEGGDATASTNANGGNVVLRPGLEDGGGSIGEVQVTNRTGTEDDPIIAFSSATGNAHTFRWRAGTVEPNTDLVPASAGGDLYVRSDGTMWIASASGTGNWSQVGTGAGGGELGEAVQNTGSTNPATMDASFAWRITDGQALTFEATDGTDIMVIAAAGGGDSVTFMSGTGTIAITDNTIAASKPGAGISDDGYVDIVPDWTGDGSHYLELSASGTNTANATQLFTGSRDPNTNVTGLPGSLYLRGDSTSSSLYVNTTSGTSPGTTWASLATSSPSQWQETTTQTTGTGAGSETFTLATLISTIPTNSQTWVEVRVIGEDTTNPDTHTYFTRELRIYYRGTGSAALWDIEEEGKEQNRGFGTEITSVDLILSGNSVIVQLTMASSTRTVDWCVQYLTKDSVTSGITTTASTGQVLAYDNRGDALTTGSATASGGTVDFDFDVVVSYGEMKFLRVVTADATVQFFRDSGRTDEIYDAENVDPSTQYTDRNPATMMGNDGSNLASNTMYGRITNNDAGAATFDVELVFWADGTVPIDTTGALEFTGTKTATYTAVAGEHVIYDPTGGTFTINMPPAPLTNQKVAIKNGSTSATAITLSGNGFNVEDPSSPGAGSASVSVSGAGVSVIYQFNGTQWWIV
jgi:hypothetical protein